MMSNGQGVCDVCNVTVNAGNWETHNSGKKHMKNLAKQRRHMNINPNRNMNMSPNQPPRFINPPPNYRPHNHPHDFRPPHEPYWNNNPPFNRPPDNHFSGPNGFNINAYNEYHPNDMYNQNSPFFNPGHHLNHNRGNLNRNINVNPNGFTPNDVCNSNPNNYPMIDSGTPDVSRLLADMIDTYGKKTYSTNENSNFGENDLIEYAKRELEENNQLINTPEVNNQQKIDVLSADKTEPVTEEKHIPEKLYFEAAEVPTICDVVFDIMDEYEKYVKL
eukprot:TRINITY_DN12123_c0_g1_i1.p1 TRINITY_DN12123_c0_g1~~TRINITY_DN12123_c0_g1_i1.p1  ORF type:complete len:275 (-),score=60.39 TRINITY_DN12123_c0_g1_i1:519-1343(-)